MLTPTANFAVDPDQTIPRRAVRFVSKLFATKLSYGQTLRIRFRTLLGYQFDTGPHCLLQRRLMGGYVREMQVMLTSMANIPVQTNIWDQDQTAPMRSGSILVTSTSFNNELVDDIWVVM